MPSKSQCIDAGLSVEDDIARETGFPEYFADTLNLYRARLRRGFVKRFEPIGIDRAVGENLCSSQRLGKLGRNPFGREAIAPQFRLGKTVQAFGLFSLGPAGPTDMRTDQPGSGRKAVFGDAHFYRIRSTMFGQTGSFEIDRNHMHGSGSGSGLFVEQGDCSR